MENFDLDEKVTISPFGHKRKPNPAKSADCTVYQLLQFTEGERTLEIKNMKTDTKCKLST